MVNRVLIAFPCGEHSCLALSGDGEGVSGDCIPLPSGMYCMLTQTRHTQTDTCTILQVHLVDCGKCTDRSLTHAHALTVNGNKYISHTTYVPTHLCHTHT